MSGARCTAQGAREKRVHARAFGPCRPVAQLVRSPRTARFAPVLVSLLIIACDVTAPDRTDSYGFALQPENVVFRWPSERLPVQYFVPAAGPLPEYARAAIESWEAQFLFGEFRAELTGDSAGADVRMLLAGGLPPAAGLTDDPPVNSCEGSTSASLADPAHLSGPIEIRLRWFPGFSPTDIANCLARVAAHEVGHSMGLLQHSNDPADLMFSAPAVRAPSRRDRSTAEILYHTPAGITPAPRTTPATK